MSVDVAEPMEWKVDGLTIAGLAWGRPDAQPVLALHGWLDNAASFSALAPLLEDYYVVALDLSGHGQSSRRSADASYQIWDDLPQLAAVIESLGWQQFAVLGHSRGAIIGGLLAAALGSRVSHLVLLDAVAPGPVAEAEFASQLGRFLEQRDGLMRREERRLDSIEQGIALRQSKGLSREAAEVLVPRSLLSVKGGYRWTNDPRLSGASAVKLTEGHINTALSSIAAATLLLLADEGHGRYPELLSTAEKSIPRLVARRVEGSHHFHIDGDVAALASDLTAFLQGELT